MTFSKENMLFIVPRGKKESQCHKMKELNGLGVIYARTVNQYKENQLFTQEKIFISSTPMDIT